MDKYDYITATIPEELDRVEKVIKYLEDNNINDSTLVEYRERYNNIKKYLNAKEKYNDIETIILEDKDKMNRLITMKEEAEVDNILLEDTLLNKFHEDTNSKYKNILYENIKYEDDSIKDILYLLFEKESDYSSLIVKRNKLKNILDKNKYPNTYNTLISQSILIDKEDSVLDEIFILENNMKIEEDKLDKIESSVMTEGILKILYEFWIVDSYDRNKVDKKKIFKDNRSLVSIKNTLNNSNNIDNKVDIEKVEDNLFPDLKLPGLNEDTLININGRDYIK